MGEEPDYFSEDDFSEHNAQIQQAPQHDIAENVKMVNILIADNVSEEGDSDISEIQVESEKEALKLKVGKETEHKSLKIDTKVTEPEKKKNEEVPKDIAKTQVDVTDKKNKIPTDSSKKNESPTESRSTTVKKEKSPEEIKRKDSTDKSKIPRKSSLTSESKKKETEECHLDRQRVNNKYNKDTENKKMDEVAIIKGDDKKPSEKSDKRKSNDLIEPMASSKQESKADINRSS